MHIQFWGTRGSHPVSSLKNAQFGGNTACTSIEFEGGKTLCIDAGTGVVDFDAYLSKRYSSIDLTVLFTHFHWDHIMGIPFFHYVYEPHSSFSVYGLKQQKRVQDILKVLFEPPFSPVETGDLPCQIAFTALRGGEKIHLYEDVALSTFETDHPNGNLAYRITQNQKSFVHLGDLEHRHNETALRNFVKGADVLVYDAHFTPTEYESPQYKGWGHATYEKGARLAQEAGIKQLILSHHAPFRDDEGVLAIEAKAKAIFPNSMAAYDGLSISI